jgi:large conductance mechanosensitive channel
MVGLAPGDSRHARRDLGMFKEFKDFLTKTNALALAIGLMIGAALGNVVTSLVDNIIMPPIGVLLGGVDFSSMVIKLKDATTDAAGKPVPEVDISYGVFINTLIAFVVIAFVVFMIARSLIKEAPAAPPEPSDEVKLLTEIRDALRKA